MPESTKGMPPRCNRRIPPTQLNYPGVRTFSNEYSIKYKNQKNENSELFNLVFERSKKNWTEALSNGSKKCCSSKGFLPLSIKEK